MTQIGNSVTSLLDRKSKPRVRISADFAFSTFWLLPRLSRLRSEIDDEIEIQILASQTPPEDDRDDCDITIHVAPAASVAPGDIFLLKEKTVAVCSPAFLDQHGPISTPAQLLHTQLLSLSKPPSAQWQTWQGWFAALGVTGMRSYNYISFNNYDMVTQAAVAGDGVALGWLGLVDDLLAKGLLVQITEDVVSSKMGYVMSRDQLASSKGPGRVFDWIAAQTGRSIADVEIVTNAKTIDADHDHP